MKCQITSIWLALQLACTANSSQALTLYVSPNGEDSNDGQSQIQESTGKGPLESVQKALAILRASRAARIAPEIDRVVLLRGEYRLSEPLVIGPEDSGSSAKYPLVIEAETPGSAVLMASRKAEGFRAVSGQAYVQTRIDLPRGFHHMWVNGQWAQRARSPNDGAFYSGGKNVVPAVPGDRLTNPRNPQNAINTQKVILPELAQTALNKASAPTKGGVLLAMQSWTSSHHQITDWDAGGGVVTVKPASQWSFLRFGPDQRFALENLLDFLDAPGEWWESPSGELRYVPRSGESINALVAEAPQLERLLEISGTEHRVVQFVQIRGLRFVYTSAWVAPFIDNQAATGVPAAVVVQRAQSFSFEQCVFENLGGHGLWLRRGSKDGLMQHNVFRRLGAGAIRVGEVGSSRDEGDWVRGHRIEDNLVEDTGWLFPGAVGIWIGQSGDNRVVHNKIQRTSYTGISVGWTWGFGASAARNNLIESNWLKQIGQARLSDLGGIYTLGISPGTVIRGNRIEDVRSFKKSEASAWGIYLDEGSSDILVEKNWVNGTTGAGFNLHYGKNNVVRDNVIMNGEIAQLRRSRRIDSSLTFEGNLIVAGARPVWEREWADDEAKTSKNLIVTEGSDDKKIQSQLRTLQAKGREAKSNWLSSRSVRCTQTSCEVPQAQKRALSFISVNVQDAGVRNPKALPN